MWDFRSLQQVPSGLGFKTFGTPYVPLLFILIKVINGTHMETEEKIIKRKKSGKRQKKKSKKAMVKK